MKHGKMIKEKIKKWLGLDDYVRQDGAKQFFEARTDIRKIVESKTVTELESLFTSRRTNYYSDEVNAVVSRLKTIVRDESRKEWNECARQNSNWLENYIKSEEFIDRIIERINRKQIKG